MDPRCIVYIHGVWMPAQEMLVMRRRIERASGIPGVLFDYPSIKGSLAENVYLLAEFIAELGAKRVDLVGHSLGGVLALRTLLEHPELPEGRTVCLGSPLAGSRAAAVLESRDWTRVLVGNTLRPAVVDTAPRTWATELAQQREIGSIAGTQPVGMGRLLARFEEENDGTVAVSETIMEGLRDHVRLPVSHAGMLVSKTVAAYALAFLQDGDFRSVSIES